MNKERAEEIIQEELVKALKYKPVAQERLKTAFEFLEKQKEIENEKNIITKSTVINFM